MKVAKDDIDPGVVRNKVLNVIYTLWLEIKTSENNQSYCIHISIRLLIRYLTRSLLDIKNSLRNRRNLYLFSLVILSTFRRYIKNQQFPHVAQCLNAL
jgi:hypothetical protein